MVNHQNRLVSSVVPQGSVLGSLLFILYVNDLPSQVKSYCKLFADDAKLYKDLQNSEDFKMIQDDLDQGSKLTVASSKFATLKKSHLLPVKNVGSKKLLTGNSVVKVISLKTKPIFTEIILVFISQNTIPYGQRHY